MKKHLLFLLIAASCTFTLTAQTPSITLTPVITGLNKPVYLTHCGDSRVFVVEQTGRIKVYDSTYNYLGVFLNVTNIITAPTSNGDERGLLGLAFHPNYHENGFFYIAFNKTVNGQLKTALARYTVSLNNSNKADSLSGVELLSYNKPYSNHNGGCLQFGPDGYLYMGTGDGGSGNDPQGNGQKLTTYLAKMLRFDVNGTSTYTIPPSNPFVNDPNAYHEIWAYGLRNPWRFSFDKLNGNLWIADVGQNAYEEVNVHYNGTPSGENYGWRCFEGLHSTGLGSGISGQPCPDFNDTHKPIYEYTHTGGECSVTGGYVYRGALYNSLFGNYICSDYCSGKMRRLIDNGDGSYTPEIIYTGDYTTSYGQDRWGELYVCSFTQNAVLKLKDGNCKPVAYVLNSNTASICGGQSITLQALFNPTLIYDWYQNGAPAVNGHTPNFTVTEPGTYYVVVTNGNGCSTASAEVIVLDKPLPDVSITAPTALCMNDTIQTLIGMPAGGTFSGNGTFGSNFSPLNAGAGTHYVTYSFTDQDGCTATDSAAIIVHPLPQLTFVNLPDTICGDVMSVTVQLIATPSGGTFSGPTVSGDILTLYQFDQFYTVTYTYTDANGCKNEITDSVLNLLCSDAPSIALPHASIYPNPANDILLFKGIQELATIQIIDLSGAEIMSTSICNNRIDLSALKNGLYFYRLVTENSVLNGKLEIAR